LHSRKEPACLAANVQPFVPHHVAFTPIPAAAPLAAMVPAAVPADPAMAGAAEIMPKAQALLAAPTAAAAAAPPTALAGAAPPAPRRQGATGHDAGGVAVASQAGVPGRSGAPAASNTAVTVTTTASVTATAGAAPSAAPGRQRDAVAQPVPAAHAPAQAAAPAASGNGAAVLSKASLMASRAEAVASPAVKRTDPAGAGAADPSPAAVPFDRAAPAPAAAPPAAPQHGGTVTATSAAGLAAAVTAMHQSGQSAAVLRLDPPGLGDLAVHVALGAGGQVNVVFIPSTPAAAAALQGNLNGLGTALAQSGLTLGQAQIGGQFNQNPGQGGERPPARPSAVPGSFEPEPPAPSGVSAYA
jgi:flagellar hook-length control protein FliK